MSVDDNASLGLAAHDEPRKARGDDDMARAAGAVPAVREAREGEAADVARVLERAFREYDGRLDPPSGVFAETPESLARQIASRQVLVCDAGAEVVGCAFCIPEDEHLYVGRFGVVPEWRRAGVGALLLAAAEDRARALGYGRIRLNVRLALDALREYYERRGYAPVAYLTHEGYPGPTYVRMEKTLS
jgi:GNAT superfamily N-acetyltransferase